MQLSLIAPIVGSVFLSSTAQVMLKAGVSRAATKVAVTQASNALEITIAFLTSPMVVLGLGVFVLSALMWLFVLSKIAVSAAYPFVALGIVTTVLAGWLVFGERLSSLSVVGVALITAGVLTLAAS